MENSGFAALVASYIISMADNLGPYALLAIIFIITNIFTELITNNAAAALSFPIALSVATQLGVNPTPFFVVICMAASASFSSPIGYQTNLIVQVYGFRPCGIAVEPDYVFDFRVRDTDDLGVLI